MSCGPVISWPNHGLEKDIPFVSNIYQQKDPAKAYDIVEFNSAYYEVIDVDDAKILKKYKDV